MIGTATRLGEFKTFSHHFLIVVFILPDTILQSPVTVCREGKFSRSLKEAVSHILPAVSRIGNSGRALPEYVRIPPTSFRSGMLNLPMILKMERFRLPVTFSVLIVISVVNGLPRNPEIGEESFRSES